MTQCGKTVLISNEYRLIQVINYKNEHVATLLKVADMHVKTVVRVYFNIRKLHNFVKQHKRKYIKTV